MTFATWNQKHRQWLGCEARGRRSPALRCFRGIDTLTSLALHLELGGDWSRLQLAAQDRWLARTDAVTVPVRRIVSLGVDHQDRLQSRPQAAGRISMATTCASPRSAFTLRNRQTGQPHHVLPIAWCAQHRLHRVHHRMRDRGKPHNVTTVAVARELAGVS
jgi:hypothetical protein